MTVELNRHQVPCPRAAAKIFKPRYLLSCPWSQCQPVEIRHGISDVFFFVLVCALLLFSDLPPPPQCMSQGQSLVKFLFRFLKICDCLPHLSAVSLYFSQRILLSYLLFCCFFSLLLPSSSFCVSPMTHFLLNKIILFRTTFMCLNALASPFTALSTPASFLPKL